MSVYSRFVAEDPDSGRKDYFPSRTSELDVTELIRKSGGLRVQDQEVVRIRGDKIEGRKPGKTEIQVNLNAKCLK